MRRLASIATLAFVLSALLVLFAVPSFAADSTEPAMEMEDGEHSEGDHSEDGHSEDKAEKKDEDEGLWTGLIASLGVGIVFGGLAFGMSGTEGLGEDHH